MRNFAAALSLSLLLATTAQAQPACPVPPVPGVALTSAVVAAGLEPARLTMDQAANVTLHPAGEVRYVTAPERAGAAGSFGGMVALDIGQAAIYQVGLGAGAWIDVLKDGKPVASTAHGHGPDCSNLRKMVSFPLTPGRHVIQLSGNKDPLLRVLVSRKE